MKKLMVLRVPSGADPKVVKKQVKLVKKLHDKLWGKDSCEVVVMPEGMELFTVADDDWSPPIASTKEV